jgi:hypothetical protein
MTLQIELVFELGEVHLRRREEEGTGVIAARDDGGIDQREVGRVAGDALVDEKLNLVGAIRP